MWIQEKSERRAHGQSHVGWELFGCEKLEEFWIGRRFALGCCKDIAEAAKVDRNIDDRHKEYDKDHGILHQGDHSWCAQATGVGIGSQDDKSNEQRYIQLEPAERKRDRDTQSRQGNLDAKHLQRDVRQGSHNPGDRHYQRKRMAAKAALHKISRGHIPMLFTHGPEAGNEYIDNRINEDCIRNGEPTTQRAQAKHSRGHRNKSIGGIQVTTQEEPGNEGSKTTACQSPLVQFVQVSTTPA